MLTLTSLPDIQLLQRQRWAANCDSINIHDLIYGNSVYFFKGTTSWEWCNVSSWNERRLNNFYYSHFELLISRYDMIFIYFFLFIRYIRLATCKFYLTTTACFIKLLLFSYLISGSVKTSFISGSALNVTWHLAYPHRVSKSLLIMLTLGIF